ncbi:MAG TPA: hypothetical protein VF691_02795 [Cytophagaceae bacterium]|jgi:hypothetical protein
MNKFFFLLFFLASNAFSQTAQIHHKIDWEKFMSNHDMVLDTMNSYWYDGAFLGNGLLGAMVHREDAKSVRWDINRSDVTDSCIGTLEGYKNTRIPIGKFVLKAKGNIISCKSRLDLWNAELNGTIITDQGQIIFKSYIHAIDMVMVTEIEGTGGEKNTDFKFVPELSACIKDWACCDVPEKGTYQSPNPTATVTVKNNVTYHTQLLQSKESFTVAYSHFPLGNKTIHVSTIAFAGRFSVNPYTAEKIMANATHMQYPKLEASHRYWWHNFYPKSFISIPDTKLESFYWIQQYKYGSATRPEGPVIDLMGPWYHYSPWRAVWWNMNIQVTYMPLYAANRLEIALPLVDILNKNFENLKKNVPKEFRHNSAGIARVSSYDLLSEINMKDTFPFGGREPGNLPWALYNYYLQYRYSMDDSLLTHFFPLLKASMNLYINLMVEGADGRLHLPVTYAPEYKAAEDCNYDLSLFRWGTSTLIEVSEKLKLKDPLIPKWRDIQKRLVDYPTNETGFRVGKDVDLTESHRHYSQMLMVYPLHIFNPTTEANKKLIERSLEHWLTVEVGKGLTAWSFTNASSISSTLGKGDDALKYLYKFLPGITSNTLYREAGPVIETPFTGANAIQDMLIQSWGGVIRVFPAIPEKWSNASINDLRTEGAFLITSKLKNGKIDFIQVKSLAGEPCKIKSNLDLAQLKIGSERKINFKKIADGVIELDLKKGESAILYSGKTRHEFTLEAVPVEANNINSFGKKFSNAKGLK